jgi:hypothetical protein
MLAEMSRRTGRDSRKGTFKFHKRSMIDELRDYIFEDNRIIFVDGNKEIVLTREMLRK